MDPFSSQPPDWTEHATHGLGFQCPSCGVASVEAEAVWINRRAPVLSETGRRRWQEFYRCTCGCPWWAGSDERPPKPLPGTPIPPQNWFDSF